MGQVKYIPQNQRDELWGLTVCSVGYQSVGPGEEYPPQGHNQEYMFSPATGRTLPEYQLLYITDGQGVLKTRHGGEFGLCPGDMFLIFPGEWHTYSPDPETGWKEYWIGFSGINIDNRVKSGFFSVENPLYHIGYDEIMVELYREAINTATRQEPYFQQLLAGIVNYLLGIMFMTGNLNLRRKDDGIKELVDMAKNAMADAVEENTSMPEIAERLNIGYTKFRRLFKEYTGLSPAQYFIDLRIHRAKEMLRGTSASIKEISLVLQFENPEYFLRYA